MGKYTEMTKRILAVRVQLEKDKNIERVSEQFDALLNCVGKLNAEDELSKDKVYALIEGLSDKILALAEKHDAELAALKSTNATLAEALQKLTKQVYLIEQNYSVINTIGGK